MPFRNRIRLPLYLKTPQFPTEANRFRLSNGESKTLSVTIRKVYTLETDYLSDIMHERLVIALNHDIVSIEGDRYIGGVSVEGPYEAQPVDFLDYPLRKATIELQVTPFDMTNDNCQTCDEATQLSLVDDDAGDIEQGGEASVNVYANDSICCFPVVAEIVFINTDYLADAFIDQSTGIVTLTAKDPVADVGSIVMANYRVTCPDGTYDEADIYGSISGGSAECEQPGDFDDVSVSASPGPYDITISWGAPTPPAGGYQWEVYDAADMGTTIDTGTSMINSVSFQVQAPSTNYRFFVRSICEEGIVSPFSEVDFSTPAAGGGNCGQVISSANDGTLGGTVYSFSYFDCDGILRTTNVVNLGTRSTCMLVNDDNVPVYYEANSPFVTYEYIEPC